MNGSNIFHISFIRYYLSEDTSPTSALNSRNHKADKFLPSAKSLIGELCVTDSNLLELVHS